MNLYLKQIELGPLQNFIYLIGCPETRETAVVDPGWDVPAILDAAAQDEMRITKILITHTHFDHINGVEEMMKATDAQVIVHKKEMGAVPVEGPSIQGVEGGAKIPLGNLDLSLLHTPGHTPGSVCFTVADRLITGDTLFVGGCGRCDLPGGDPELMYKSLTRLKQMDDHLVLYPGHNYAPEQSAPLGREKGRNPFLAAPSQEAFLNLVGGVIKR
jgi:glyoxylase-like metal-dependent hydrolase (beta-lactamase superfamily II)